jgi:hypothetical protein
MTAFVERVNLTLGEHVPPLSRRTWFLARDEHSLQMLSSGFGLTIILAVTTRACAYPINTLAVIAHAPRRWRVSAFLLLPLPAA